MSEPYMSLEWRDELTTGNRHICVTRRGKPPIEITMSREEFRGYESPAHFLSAMEMAVAKEIAHRQRNKLFPDNRHEERNFG